MLINRDVERVISSYVKEHKFGVFIFNGPKGVLKLFTSELVSNLLFKDYGGFIPFSHPDIYTYGVYDYSLHYKFFVKNISSINNFGEFFFRFSSFVSSLRVENSLKEGIFLYLHEVKKSGDIDINKVKKFLEDLEEVIEKLNKVQSVGIDVVRDISEFVNMTSISGNKVVLISGFENATIEAQNSFLKTLEDLPNNTFVILLTNNIERVLPTIRSRSFIVNFMYLKGVEIGKFFKGVFNVDNEKYYSIYDLIVDNVYDVNYRLQSLVSKGFFSDEISDAIEIAEEFSQDEILTRLFFELSSEVLNTLLMIRGKIAGLDVDFPNDYLKLISKEKIRKYDIASLTKLQKVLDESYYNVYVYNLDPKVVISNFLLEARSVS
jgi:hypothetical protein